MSVKQIRLHIKPKRKFHNNLGHKEHSAHSPHPHNLFANISQILKLFPHHHLHTSTANHTQSDKCDKREEICIGSNISAVE